MARVVTLQDTYAGMRQDEPRAEMRKGAVWNNLDYVPSLGAPLRKRGGWAYGSPALNGVVSGGAGYVPIVAYAPFTAGSKLIAITNTGRLATIASTSSATDVGATRIPAQQPVMHAGKLILPHNDGAATPYYYDGTTLAALGGSPPAGKYAAVYKDRTLLGFTVAQPDRVYFSQAADPAATWDTTNSWISVSNPVSGLAALANVALVFMRERTARLRGSVPPAQAGSLGMSDMITDDPLFNVGCADARSIVTTGGFCIFANEEGVYLTNGTSSPEDLTESVGLKRYYGELLSAFSSTWTLAGGMHRSEYWLSIADSQVHKDCIVFDIQRRTARRVSNVTAQCFASSSTIGDELYFAAANLDRVGKLSTTYTPSATYKEDAEGSDVLPVVEFPYYTDKPGKKTWRSVYFNYDLRDAASDNPVLTASYIRNPDDTAYTALSPTLTETTVLTRARRALRFGARGIGLKIVQTGNSADTRIYELEADLHPREGSRL